MALYEYKEVTTVEDIYGMSEAEVLKKIPAKYRVVEFRKVKEGETFLTACYQFYVGYAFSDDVGSIRLILEPKPAPRRFVYEQCTMEESAETRGDYGLYLCGDGTINEGAVHKINAPLTWVRLVKESQ